MPWMWSSMKALCEEFARTTSAHGFAHLDTSGSAVARRFWGLTCFVALVAVVVGLSSVTYRYLLYPTRVAMQLSTKQLPFPAVTICNQRPTDFYTVADIVYDEVGQMRWTMGNFSYTGRPGASRFEMDVVKYINSYAVFFDFLELSETHGVYGENLSDYESWLYRNTLYSRPVQNANIRARADLGGTQAKHFIVDCSFAGKRGSWEKFTHFVDPAYLNCYSFDPADMNITIPPAGGPANGLNLMLFVPHITALNLSHSAMGHMALSPDLSYAGEGVRISIHPQKSMAFPSVSGNDAPRGHSLSIGVTGKEIKRASPPYGNCSNIPNYQLKSGYSHSFILCSKVCLQAVITERCNCFDFSLPFDDDNVTACQEFDPIPVVCRTISELLNNYEFCTGFILAWYARNQCVEDVRQDYESIISGCDCHPQCDQFSYTFSLGLTKWPMYEQTRALLQTILANPEFQTLFEPGRYETYFHSDTYPIVSWEEAIRHTDQENFMRIGVYISDSSFIQVSEEPLYSLVELLSGFGGQLGLWAGVSILTLMAVFMFMYSMLKVISQNIFQKQKDPRMKNSQVDPNVYTIAQGNDGDRVARLW